MLNWEIQRRPTGLKEVLLSSKEMDINIYPNPFHDCIKINFKQNLEERLKVEVIDVTGKIQLTQIFAPQEEYLLNLSHLNSGYYMINLYLDKTLIANTNIIKQ